MATAEALARRVADDGGVVLATYRDPLGGRWQLLADAIDRLDRFLDPIVAVPAPDGGYWSPNGYHRLGAMQQLGAKAIVALVAPEPEVAHRILALNTEKAHNLRERQGRPGGPERRCALERGPGAPAGRGPGHESPPALAAYDG